MAKRMQFISELQASITKQLVEQQGLSAPLVERAFQRWNDGKEPETPIDHGCFEVFRTIQKDVERTPLA